MSRSLPFAALALSALGIFALSSTALAGRYADIEVTWSDDCSTVTVDSTKELSNIVVRLDGALDDGSEDDKTEYGGGVYTVDLDATDITVVWVKSGANASGDGPGYGERFELPEDCDGFRGDNDD